MVDKVDWIWMDGELVRWDDANVHILTHTLHYGLGAFEGIRAYRRADGRSVVFRLAEHIDRLFASCHLVRMELPFTREQLTAASLETLARNGLDEGYVRLLAYVGMGRMGLYAIDNPIHVAVIAWRWGAYLGDEGLQKGIRARVSSFLRQSPTSTMSKGKIVGHYVNSIMAKREAMADGYDEAILLDQEGYVTEASGENAFLVQNGVVKTPPFGTAVLGGITRDTGLALLRDAGVPVVEARFARDELYLADEVFLTGTAAEFTPVREIDHRRIGSGEPGPVTKELQRRFFEVVRGAGEKPYARWLTPYEPARL